MIPRFAIHAHIYYRELWTELAACIDNFREYAYDLFVTTPREDDELRQRILTDFPQAVFRVTENRGYDVGPFVEILNNLKTKDYDFIVKLHTKRDYDGVVNLRYLRGNEWRKRLLDFCATPENLKRTLVRFIADARIGMISHGSLITEKGDFLEDSFVSRKAEEIISAFDLRLVRRSFVAGNCFIVRSEIFKPLVGMFTLSDFDLSADHKASLAHILERVFGYLVSAQGYELHGLPRALAWRDWMITPFLPIHKLIRTTRRILSNDTSHEN